MSTWRRQLTFLAFAGPALLVFAVMMLWPLVNMFRVSTLNWRGIVKPQTFTGLDNYARLLSDPVFTVALKNTAIHIAVALPGVLLPAFMLGFFLSLRPPGHRFLRPLYFTPVLMAAPAQAMLFLGLYLPDGIINQALRSVNLDALTRVWLGDTSTALGAIIAMDLWSGIGFYAVLFYTVLSNVPRELYESAEIDGARYGTVMWRIAFPVTLDFFGVAAMLHFLYLLLTSAQHVLLLTQGGPGNASMTLSYYLYHQAFNVRNLGYSQALGVVIFFVGLLGMLVIRRATHGRFR